MAVQATQDFGEIQSPKRVNEFRRFLKVFFGRPVVVIGLVIIAVLLICAVIPSVLAPHDPTAQNLRNTLAQPNSTNILGTDSLGRDLFSRIIYGARTAVIVGFSALIMSSVLGMTLGLMAGYFGKLAYTIIMRFIDALMAFPALLLTLTIVALLGGGMHMVIIALG
ncbi:MAG TPA: ABC transporter permease, partial [Candidatus Limnocylindrales bacterium]|nr:ABC transporter permease [Candidatus Limnocylindrales bacterium]